MKRQAGMNYNRDEKRTVICLQFSGTVVASVLPQSLTVCDSTIQTFLLSSVTINVKRESCRRRQPLFKNKWVHFYLSLTFLCLLLYVGFIFQMITSLFHSLSVAVCGLYIIMSHYSAACQEKED